MAPTASKLDELIEQMTQAEKAGQLTQFFYLAAPGGTEVDPAADSPFAKQPEMVEAAVRDGGA
ncbi:MAG: hypothetical protein ABWZ76_08030, partial [Acidimicrobiales bacterium]